MLGPFMLDHRNDSLDRIINLAIAKAGAEATKQGVTPNELEINLGDDVYVAQGLIEKGLLDAGWVFVSVSIPTRTVTLIRAWSNPKWKTLARILQLTLLQMTNEQRRTTAVGVALKEEFSRSDLARAFAELRHLEQTLMEGFVYIDVTKVAPSDPKSLFAYTLKI